MASVAACSSLAALDRRLDLLMSSWGKELLGMVGPQLIEGADLG